MFLEYFLTMGIILAFSGLVVGIVLDRKNIADVLKKHRIGRLQVTVAIMIALLFVCIEVALVKPTQQLFFDDAIYQGMAIDLIHMGQALMCDYGTPSVCYIGEVFHEPIGTSFNFAIAFLIFGIHRIVAYGTEFFLAALAVFMSFFATSLITKNHKIGYFTELFMALSPVILVWAFPTTSDMPTLAYSLVSLFFLLIFIYGKNALSFSNLLFSMALLAYMKVFAILYIPLFLVIYILLDNKSMLKSIKNNFKLLIDNLLNTNVLIILLVFIVAITPEIFYSIYEFENGSYGATMIQNTCSASMQPMNYTGTMSLDNFEYNFCANFLYWFDNYSDVYIMQPIIFTIFALIGVVYMVLSRQRNELLAIGLWFIFMFVLYDSFYAGGVIYGVDWRFMLSLVYQACFFSGMGAWFIYNGIGKTLHIRRGGKNTKTLAVLIALALLFTAIFYPIFALAPLLSVKPSAILQAGSARFDENFVYTNISAIPNNCLVFSYVPYLFNINNRSGAQMFYLFNNSFMQNAEQNYSCLVIDYGYWCGTPNNMCGDAMDSYKTVPLRTATYTKSMFNFTFGFYKITGKNS